MEDPNIHPDHGEAAAGHPRFLAHHFDSARQQFDAGKLGIWLFLLTEVLFFGGLFCVYAVYRSSYPEIFRDAGRYLDVRLGALNTCVLILSSLTIAWAVRCAQLGQRRALVALLAVTFCCAGAFLGVKFIEYKQKWEHGLMWSGLFNPTAHEAPEAAPPAGDPSSTAGDRGQADPSKTFDKEVASQQTAEAAREEGPRRRHLGMFFAVYFGMTGLHGIHVLAGMGVIAWILVRAAKGHFGPEYFGPVDYTALYWHLVDMIWIFLFPLLYLIH